MHRTALHCNAGGGADGDVGELRIGFSPSPPKTRRPLYARLSAVGDDATAVAPPRIPRTHCSTHGGRDNCTITCTERPYTFNRHQF